MGGFLKIKHAGAVLLSTFLVFTNAGSASEPQKTTYSIWKELTLEQVKERGTDTVSTVLVLPIGKPLVVFNASSAGDVDGQTLRTMLFCRADQYRAENGYDVMAEKQLRLAFWKPPHEPMAVAWHAEFEFFDRTAANADTPQAPDYCSLVPKRLMGGQPNKSTEKPAQTRCNDHACLPSYGEQTY
jgi:hypothetical protein